MSDMYNLLMWDAFGNYQVLESAKTFEQCKVRQELEAPLHKEYVQFEILPIVL